VEFLNDSLWGVAVGAGAPVTPVVVVVVVVVVLPVGLA
jgi:hypothetical protein